jgi:hypothetical protein
MTNVSADYIECMPIAEKRLLVKIGSMTAHILGQMQVLSSSFNNDFSIHHLLFIFFIPIVIPKYQAILLRNVPG